MIDETFHYHTRYNLVSALDLSTEAFQGEAKCRVRVNGNTVIASELPDNPGMSLTNAAEEVAMQVAGHYEIPLGELTWIEHYPEEPNHEESFDRVDFSFERGRLTKPRWKPITKEEAIGMLGDYHD
ncbi:MAG: hypothetical protein F6K47_04095 [Symploca sp. SIO2E6]|nr:hypothetical protein [Symploca sp. SIO2E6]